VESIATEVAPTPQEGLAESELPVIAADGRVRAQPVRTFQCNLRDEMQRHRPPQATSFPRKRESKGFQSEECSSIAKRGSLGIRESDTG